MALHVRLQLHVDSVALAEVVEVRIVRIVARAHRVNVVALHQKDVSQHLVTREGTPIHGGCVVSVHALELHRTSVYKDRAVRANLGFHEPDLARTNVVTRFDDKRIQIGVFCGPCMKRRELKVYSREFIACAVCFFDRPKVCIVKRGRDGGELRISVLSQVT